MDERDYFGIGFRAESAIIEIKKIQNNKSYNKYIVDDSLEIVRHAKTALISKDCLKDKLAPYDKIFPCLLNQENLEERREKSKLAYKTIHTLKKMILERNPSEKELEDAKEFLGIISDKCLIFGNPEFATQ